MNPIKYTRHHDYLIPDDQDIDIHTLAGTHDLLYLFTDVWTNGKVYLILALNKPGNYATLEVLDDEGTSMDFTHVEDLPQKFWGLPAQEQVNYLY